MEEDLTKRDIEELFANTRTSKYDAKAKQSTPASTQYFERSYRDKYGNWHDAPDLGVITPDMSLTTSPNAIVAYGEAEQNVRRIMEKNRRVAPKKKVVVPTKREERSETKLPENQRAMQQELDRNYMFQQSYMLLYRFDGMTLLDKGLAMLEMLPEHKEEARLRLSLSEQIAMARIVLLHMTNERKKQETANQLERAQQRAERRRINELNREYNRINGKG